MLIHTAPNNPHPERLIGAPLDGYWHLGTSKGCFEKGPYSRIIGNNFYTKIEPNKAPFLWGKLENIKIESQKIHWTFISEINKTQRKQVFLDKGNYLISEYFSIKRANDKEFKQKRNFNGDIYLTSCGVLSLFNKLGITLRYYNYREIRPDFLEYVD